MAYIGLANPTVANRDEAAGTYSGGSNVGKAISVNISPQYAEGSLYADNVQSEYEKEFKYADVTLGTDCIPIAMCKTMFGHEVDEKKVVYKASDSAPYVGVGLYVTETVGGVRSYCASWLFKAKFSEPSEDYQTKGENIEFKTPSISGRALADEMHEYKWKETETFDTEEEAKAWLAEMAGETAAAASAAAEEEIPENSGE